ncbi:WD40-repeat-containing domain protein [Cokeromyces recurvatus]|uniref:WD40-repeat-containing domain protein n=1 Tax=Cokeromyces recurvatus TaxID=90255 RepID=UPI00221F31A8|nr:WD40-repeat-containing domain protein [Cokeromyces recurvatus]KAI7900836.1 WD40-repeat-containing domain protein [Cokeromyces recurvatus]
MSELESGGEFYDALNSPLPVKNDSRYNETGLYRRQDNKRNSFFQNKESTCSDHNQDSLATSSNVKSNASHRRTKSISFEEYSYGSMDHHSLSSSFKRHSRVHSWSETNLSATSPFSSIHRKSHESNRSSILVGVHNYFHPPNTETPPHGKSYVKIKTKITTNKKFNRVVLAQTLVTDTSEVILPSIDIKDEVVENKKRPINAVWICQFSKDGKYMATAGQNCVIHVWKVLRDFKRSNNIDVQDMMPHEPSIKVFHDSPVRNYTGHTADILDISWSRNNFLISGSMDKTVRLWHISQNVCLCVFKHSDLVTSVQFHPKDDRFFLSGSFDGKIRIWSIPEKRVAFWNEVPTEHVVTAVAFTLDGRTVCVGSNSGDVFFYETQGLKYNTQVLVKHARNKHGKKVTGIEPMPGMPLGEERILVTTNDSRVWIINMKDKSFVYKYKGIDNSSMQIRASFSDDGRYIICGSENGCVYLWRTDQVNYSPFQYLHDSSIKAAVALGHLGDQIIQNALQTSNKFSEEEFSGITGWLKRGERRMIDKLRSRNEHFMAHQHTVTSAIFAPTRTRQLLAKAGGDIIFDNTPVYTHRCMNNQEEDNDSSLKYDDDETSFSRKSKTSSSYNDDRSESRHQQQMNELHKYLLNKFEKANQEERDRFDYPDSQIIISADLHGAIKVWRMDSGYYNTEEDEKHHIKKMNSTSNNSSLLEESTYHNLFKPVHKNLNTISESSSVNSIKSAKKTGLSSLFSKLKH